MQAVRGGATEFTQQGGPDAKLVREVAGCLARECRQELEAIIASSDTTKHFGVPIDVLNLAKDNASVATELLTRPTSALQLLDAALIAAQAELINVRPPAAHEEACVKELVHARVHSLPYFLDPDSPLLNPRVGRIGSPHVGKLVTLSAVVVRAGQVQIFDAYRLFRCAACGREARTATDVCEPGKATVPSECSSPDCPGAKFKPVEGGPLHTNYQEIHIQERMQAVEMGSLPHSMTAVMMHDLADTCQVGDAIEVTGIVMQRAVSSIGNGSAPRVCIFLLATHAHKSPLAGGGAVPIDDAAERRFVEFWRRGRAAPVRARNAIVANVCRQLSGLFDVKLALLLTMIGGVRKQHGEHVRTRGELHMLLVGDPGTGKSLLVRFAARMAPRSVTTTGRGTSCAGLTAAATKEAGQWTLQAGAMVLADGGLCCIDEFGDVPQAERTALHEAMEQQTVSVAKAGMVTTLNARTSVLAAMNPIHSYNGTKSITANTGLSVPLISRFDVVLVLRDSKEQRRDERVADAILGLADASAAAPSGGRRGADADERAAGGGKENTASGSVDEWGVEEMQQYIGWARQTFDPTVGAEAEEVLMAYYHKQRQLADLGMNCENRVTVRFLESLVRLSQAHARLMCHSVVDRDDAVAAVILADLCEHTSSVTTLAFSAPPHAACSHDDAGFASARQHVLRALNLSSAQLLLPPPADPPVCPAAPAAPGKRPRPASAPDPGWSRAMKPAQAPLPANEAAGQSSAASAGGSQPGSQDERLRPAEPSPQLPHPQSSGRTGEPCSTPPVPQNPCTSERSSGPCSNSHRRHSGTATDATGAFFRGAVGPGGVCSGASHGGAANGVQSDSRVHSGGAPQQRPPRQAASPAVGAAQGGRQQQAATAAALCQPGLSTSKELVLAPAYGGAVEHREPACEASVACGVRAPPQQWHDSGGTLHAAARPQGPGPPAVATIATTIAASDRSSAASLNRGAHALDQGPLLSARPQSAPCGAPWPPARSAGLGGGAVRQQLQDRLGSGARDDLRSDDQRGQESLVGGASKRDEGGGEGGIGQLPAEGRTGSGPGVGVQAVQSRMCDASANVRMNGGGLAFDDEVTLDDSWD